jgi:hypothetical protein
MLNARAEAVKPLRLKTKVDCCAWRAGQRAIEEKIWQSYHLSSTPGMIVPLAIHERPNLRGGAKNNANRCRHRNPTRSFRLARSA